MDSDNLIDAHEPLTFVDDDSIPARNSSVIDMNSSVFLMNKSLNRSVATMRTVDLDTPSVEKKLLSSQSSVTFVNPQEEVENPYLMLNNGNEQRNRNNFLVQYLLDYDFNSKPKKAAFLVITALLCLFLVVLIVRLYIKWLELVF